MGYEIRGKMHKIPGLILAKFKSLGFLVLKGIVSSVESFIYRITRRAVKCDPSEYDLKYSNVAFLSEDGLMMRGWWFETGRDRPVIICLHGVGANRAEPAARVFGIAEELLSSGYNVLAFDFRAHGESEGKHTSAGFYEKNDLLGAIKYVRQCGFTGKIGLLGFSMGAAISLLAAAESQEIAAVIADSSFVDVVSVIQSEFSKRKYLPKFLIPVIFSISKLLYKIDYTLVRPVESLKLINIPVFIIHGGLDEIIPVAHAYRLKKACRNLMSQLWIVPEAHHTSAYFIKPEEYVIRMLTFFKKAFAPRPENKPSGIL